MRSFPALHLFLTLSSTILLTGCGKHGAPEAAKPASSPTASAATPVPQNTSATLPAAATSETFSVAQVPMSSAALPPFPFLSFPAALPENARKNDQEFAFEEVEVVAGSTLRKVEGRVLTRFFSNSQAGLSASGARRNYEQALEALGAVRVNQIKPTDSQLAGKDGDIEKTLQKMRLPDAGPRFEDRGLTGYDSYLLRSAQGNVWATVASDADGLNTFLVVVQEKPLVQSVTALTAESLSKALKTDGHMALYLSFDTDKTTLRPDSSAVINEVVKLMTSDPTLRLRIEGHTDNVGNAGHNQTLSAGRAESVKSALVAKKIDGARLETEGFGATRPIADNAEETGRLKNRRVELVKL